MEQGATMLVNRLTAGALTEEARLGRQRAIVQTAAASTLGRMLVRLGQRFSIPLTNVVRRTEQMELLRKMGANYVLNRSDADFDVGLQELCRRLGATIGFDAVAGESRHACSLSAPRESPACLWRSVARDQPSGSCSADIRRKMGGGLLAHRMATPKNMVSRFRVSQQVQRLLARDLRTEIRARISLEDAACGLAQYAANVTDGKILLMPSRTAGNDRVHSAAIPVRGVQS